MERIAMAVCDALLANIFAARAERRHVTARACGHSHPSEFNLNDLTPWKRDMAKLASVAMACETSP